MFREYLDLLPPHWYKDEDEKYSNELTMSSTENHPLNVYLQNRHQMIRYPDNIDPLRKMFQAADSSNYEHHHQQQQQGNEYSNDNNIDNRNNMSTVNTTSSSHHNHHHHHQLEGDYHEFHCQWTEHDGLGKKNIFGLTIRYYLQSLETLIKFDGIDGEWVNTEISGPSGDSLDQYDLFIGAKVIVFGRHLTISSASNKAIQWIEREKKRLEKQQESFRQMITCIGKIPCIRERAAPDIVRHITRGRAIPPGHENLRRLKMENVKLGEQVVTLGLGGQL